MSVKYVLYPNPVTPDPKDCKAVVVPTRTVGQEGVIARIMERGSTVTPADLKSVFEDFESATESLLLEGVNICMPLVNFSVSIKGVFTNPQDKFDPSRHQIVANAQPGKRIRGAIAQNATAEKTEAKRPTPNPISFMDVTTKEQDSLVTSGGMGQIVGHRLSFDEDDPTQGIFFISDTKEASRVAMVAKNKPSELIFQIPILARGSYSLDVRASMGTNQQVTTGLLQFPLSVL